MRTHQRDFDNTIISNLARVYFSLNRYSMLLQNVNIKYITACAR